VVLGGIPLLAAWLIGPAMGLASLPPRATCRPCFARHNKNGAPVGVLILQAVIGTAISLLYVFIPGVNTAYWIMSAMTVTLLCIAYLLIFAALIQLRYSQPDVKRAFQDPGRAWSVSGSWAGWGFLATAMTFVISMLPIGGIPMSGPLYVVIHGGRHRGAGAAAAGLLEIQEGQLEVSWQESLARRRINGGIAWITISCLVSDLQRNASAADTLL